MLPIASLSTPRIWWQFSVCVCTSCHVQCFQSTEGNKPPEHLGTRGPLPRSHSLCKKSRSLVDVSQNGGLLEGIGPYFESPPYTQGGMMRVRGWGGGRWKDEIKFGLLWFAATNISWRSDAHVTLSQSQKRQSLVLGPYWSLFQWQERARNKSWVIWCFFSGLPSDPPLKV